MKVKSKKKVSAQSDVIDMGYALFQSNIMSFGDESITQTFH